jgi:hypothetical protein
LKGAGGLRERAWANDHAVRIEDPDIVDMPRKDPDLLLLGEPVHRLVERWSVVPLPVVDNQLAQPRASHTLEHGATSEPLRIAEHGLTLEGEQLTRRAATGGGDGGWRG